MRWAPSSAFELEMHVLLAVLVAGATKTSSDLKTGTAELAQATTTFVAGGGDWGSMMKEETPPLSVNTKLVFKWSGGHNVVLVTKAAYESCTLGDADSDCVATDPDHATGDCLGGNVVAKVDNKYTYEAVLGSAGEYYFICAVPGHCTNQKIKVTVDNSPTGSGTGGGGGDGSGGGGGGGGGSSDLVDSCDACCPAGKCDSTADASKPECKACMACQSSEPPKCPSSPPPSPPDSAAASLGSGALGTTLLAVATAALLRGFDF